MILFFLRFLHDLHVPLHNDWDLSQSQIISGFTTLVFCALCNRSLCINSKMSHSCCSSTFFARLVCCGLGFASYLLDLLVDDRILPLHGVLDDPGLFHIHCVKVVMGVYVHNLFNGSLLDLVLRFPIFSWSLRVRDLLCDFQNSGDLLLLSTESEESRSNKSDWSQ